MALHLFAEAAELRFDALKVAHLNSEFTCYNGFPAGPSVATLPYERAMPMTQGLINEFASTV